MSEPLRIVMVGEAMPGSRTPQRRDAFRAAGHHVTFVPTTVDGRDYETRPGIVERLLYRLRMPRDPAGANEAMIRAARQGCDVAWVENARMIRAEALAAVKSVAPSAKLIWYSEDDTMNPRHRTVWMERAMPLYDLWVTTKSFNAEPGEVPSLGARRVLFVDNTYDPVLHRPVAVTETERARLGADVGFVGTFETPRAEAMLALAKSGQRVRVWGNGWDAWAGRHENLTIEGRPVYGEDYVKTLCATKINLCFLRAFNRDRQTCRSMEIPACGAFMAHERNDEIAGLFAEDAEAAFFADADELIALCRRWLADDAGRARVAAAGRARVVADRRDHAALLERVVGAVTGEAAA